MIENQRSMHEDLKKIGLKISMLYIKSCPPKRLSQESKFPSFNSLSKSTQARKKQGSHDQQVLEYDNTQVQVLETETKTDSIQKT